MKIIIWGTGSMAKKVYNKLKLDYEIIGFCDSNSQKWNKLFLEKEIFSPLKCKEMNVDIIIASEYYEEIIDSMIENGFEIQRIGYISPKTYLIHHVSYKFKGGTEEKESKIKRILFVQSVPGIRIAKIATVLREKGIRSDLAYLHDSVTMTGMGMEPYEKVISINDISKFVQYVNSENYDLVFSANEPDYLTNLLLETNKKVVHDTADMMSLRGDITIEQLIHEYIANRRSSANMYVTDLVKNIAYEKFSISYKKCFVLNNYVLKSMKPRKYLNKLSNTDSEMHCVYEGGITEDTNHHRYYEKIFKKIADNRIHVHFYSAFDNGSYCEQLAQSHPYIHYEGSLEYEELQTELTKYDIGLVLLNITKRNNTFLQTTFPNKIFEYLFAALPVAISPIDSLVDFVHEYQVGDCLDFDGDIQKQLSEIKKIGISHDFLEKNRLTMDDYADDIIGFLENVVYGN